MQDASKAYVHGLQFGGLTRFEIPAGASPEGSGLSKPNTEHEKRSVPKAL